MQIETTRRYPRTVFRMATMKQEPGAGEVTEKPEPSCTVGEKEMVQLFGKTVQWILEKLKGELPTMIQPFRF